MYSIYVCIYIYIYTIYIYKREREREREREMSGRAPWREHLLGPPCPAAPFFTVFLAGGPSVQGFSAWALCLGVKESQDSSKGGAVERGCSDLNDVIYVLVNYIILRPSTAPPSHCTPL